jgi:prephenate dehydratase
MVRFGRRRLPLFLKKSGRGERVRIAIQGELGSFSHEAALRMTGDAAEVVPCPVSGEVFRLVGERGVDAAVIPIENSLAGPVAEHYDLLLEADVAIEREAPLRIRHNLIALPGADIGGIDRAASHPVALAQCRRFFDVHRGIRPIPHYDTAGSVRQMVEAGDLSASAIASAQAAEQYGGVILAAGIEDNPANFTRFFLIRRQELVVPDPTANKVSLAFTVENRPGTLVEALQVFAAQGANLTKIESRPVQGKPWQYFFYVDYQIPSAEVAGAVLKSLQSACSMVKELGRYRSADEPL